MAEVVAAFRIDQEEGHIPGKAHRMAEEVVEGHHILELVHRMVEEVEDHLDNPLDLEVETRDLLEEGVVRHNNPVADTNPAEDSLLDIHSFKPSN